LSEKRIDLEFLSLINFHGAHLRLPSHPPENNKQFVPVKHKLFNLDDSS